MLGVTNIKSTKLVEKLGESLGTLSFLRGAFPLKLSKAFLLFKKPIVLGREIQLVGHSVDLFCSSRTKKGQPST